MIHSIPKMPPATNNDMDVENEEEEQVFTGPARCFESEEEAFAAVKAREYKEGEVIVIRNEGPSGGPGMSEGLHRMAFDRCKFDR